MKLVLWRALLAPLTSIRALLVQRRGVPLSYDAAWCQARLDRFPDEMVYRLHRHQATTSDQPSSALPLSASTRKDEPTDRRS